MPLSEKAQRSKDRSASVPQMQHRHFAFIASCIRLLPRGDLRLPVANVFAAALRHTNIAFDGTRFFVACDAEPEEWTLEELDRSITHATLWLDHMRQERQRRGFEQGEAA